MSARYAPSSPVSRPALVSASSCSPPPCTHNATTAAALAAPSSTSMRADLRRLLARAKWALGKAREVGAAMQISLRVVIIGASAALAFPGAAEAAGFKDRVITGAVAHASQLEGTTKRWPAGDTTIRVTVASSFRGGANVAGTYAAFPGSLPHGPELASLKVIVVPAAEINADCGGKDGDGILACYPGGEQTMIVPGDSSGDDSVSVN